MSLPLRATYRVQLHAQFPFSAAADLADYFQRLGISHLYTSPYLQAAPGSTHGYDMVDPSRVNRELGGAPGHALFCRALAGHGLGQVLDVVPNHMAITGPENQWWWDVLENGPSSRYASYFDVDWDSPQARLSNKVLLPVLGDHYGRILEAGEIRLMRRGSNFLLCYHDHAFPVAPRSLVDLLARAADLCGSEDLAFISDALDLLPLPTATDLESTARRHRDKEVLRTQLSRLLSEQAGVATTIDAVIAEINGDPDALDELISGQNYRLARWRTANRDIGYRRFFDISTLVGLRMENETVFRDTHRLVLRWLHDGTLGGLRIDHVDGLRDPEAYLQRLRAAAHDAWLVVEKILMPGERLPDSWPVSGTTGYDFLNQVGGLFVDPYHEAPLTAFYQEFTGESTDYAYVVREMKHSVMHEVLGSDVNRLTELMLQVCENHRRHRDFTRFDVHETLREVIACLPVYRTYARATTGTLSPADRDAIQRAIERAKEYRDDLDRELLDFLRDVLMLRYRGELEDELAMRFQQLTGSAMAKGVEDTAYYVYNRFVALNEVGGAPDRFGLAVADFHQAMEERQREHPAGMLSTSTHDTKRSEDVRARLYVLSEIPQAWIEAVRRWAGRNEGHRTGGMPDRNTEYLFYQTLVGAWPIETDRMAAYMEKAAREAGRHTSWIRRNEEYEQALRGFVEGVLADEGFCADLQGFVAPLVGPGRISSLAQTLIKLTAPGVPDIYQGCELWDNSLVDPDNRRPVDFALRERLLTELDGLTPDEILGRMDAGLPKLWVICQALRLRAERPELFAPASTYRALEAHGERAYHAVAFTRAEGVTTIVPRLALTLGGDWRDTRITLPPDPWRNVLTGESGPGGEHALGELLGSFPVALLARAGSRA